MSITCAPADHIRQTIRAPTHRKDISPQLYFSAPNKNKSKKGVVCRYMYTAGIPPAKVTGTPILALWWSPAPFIVELHRIRAVGGIVADEIDVRVLVQVRVGVELSGDEVLNLARTRSSDKGESVDGRNRAVVAV